MTPKDPESKELKPQPKPAASKEAEGKEPKEDRKDYVKVREHLWKKKYYCQTFLTLSGLCHKLRLTEGAIAWILEQTRLDLERIERANGAYALGGDPLAKTEGAHNGGNGDTVCGTDIRACTIEGRQTLCHYTLYCPARGEAYWVMDGEYIP